MKIQDVKENRGHQTLKTLSRISTVAFVHARKRAYKIYILWYVEMNVYVRRQNVIIFLLPRFFSRGLRTTCVLRTLQS